MSRLADWYKRLRHSRGFGIHSPSAYRLIREVLRPDSRYGYYAYQDIREITDPDYSYRELCLIYRLLVDSAAASVAIVHDHSALRALATLALPAAVILEEPERADFAIIGHGCSVNFPPRAVDALAECGQIFFCENDSKLSNELLGRMRAGHSFRSKRHTLIVNRSDLPLEHFNLNF